jgi:hypothetical protein
VPGQQLEQPCGADVAQVGPGGARHRVDERVERTVVAREVAGREPALTGFAAAGDEQAEAAGARIGDAGERRIERISHVRAP